MVNAHLKTLETFRSPTLRNSLQIASKMVANYNYFMTRITIISAMVIHNYKVKLTTTRLRLLKPIEWHSGNQSSSKHKASTIGRGLLATTNQLMTVEAATAMFFYQTTKLVIKTMTNSLFALRATLSRQMSTDLVACISSTSLLPST